MCKVLAAREIIASIQGTERSSPRPLKFIQTREIRVEHTDVKWVNLTSRATTPWSASPFPWGRESTASRFKHRRCRRSRKPGSFCGQLSYLTGSVTGEGRGSSPGLLSPAVRVSQASAFTESFTGGLSIYGALCLEFSSAEPACSSLPLPPHPPNFSSGHISSGRLLLTNPTQKYVNLWMVHAAGTPTL